MLIEVEGRPLGLGPGHVKVGVPQLERRGRAMIHQTVAEPLPRHHHRDRQCHRPRHSHISLLLLHP